MKTLAEIFEKNPDIMLNAVANSLIMKIATDSPQAGGVTIEMNSEEEVNNAMDKLGLPYVAMTIKGIKRFCSRKGEQILDFSMVGAKSLREFEKLIKTSDNKASAADLFLFEISGGRLTLVDCTSFKTSTSAKVNSIYLHNDSDGGIYSSIVSGAEVSIGKVLLLTLNQETCACEFYLAEGNFSKFTELFTERTVEELSGSEITYHGKELVDKSGMTTRSGKNRGLIKVINREKKNTKKDGTGDLKATSFTRGITVDKGFLPVLASRGIIKKIGSFSVPVDEIEEADFIKRYPQLNF